MSSGDGRLTLRAGRGARLRPVGGGPGDAEPGRPKRGRPAAQGEMNRMQDPNPTRAASAAGPDGWVLFAGVMILMAGVFNGLDGFVALLRSSYFSASPAVGSLYFWSLVWIAFGVLQVIAGLAILGNQSWARWFGIAAASVNALIQLVAIGIYP